MINVTYSLFHSHSLSPPLTLTYILFHSLAQSLPWLWPCSPTLALYHCLLFLSSSLWSISDRTHLSTDQFVNLSLTCDLGFHFSNKINLWWRCILFLSSDVSAPIFFSFLQTFFSFWYLGQVEWGLTTPAAWRGLLTSSLAPVSPKPLPR